jgi:hypothetical protein
MTDDAPGTVRSATLLDTPRIARLLAGTAHARELGVGEVNALLDRGYLLVLDRCDGTLAAVAHVDMEAGRARMDLLVVEPGLEDSAVVARMTGVARALGEAYGCNCLEGVSPPRPRGPRGRR